MPKPGKPIINWSHPISKGLVLDVPFFEGGGSNSLNLVDLVKGTNTNTPIYQNELFGKVMTFASASSQYVDIGATSYLTLNRNFSIMALVKQTTSLTAGKAIISHTFGGYYLRMNGGNVDFLESQVADILNGNTTTSLNTWNMVGVTIDSPATANVIVYLNGVKDGSTTTSTTVNSNTRTLKIGVDQNNSSILTEFFDGSMAYVRIWNRVLSPQEVKQLYANPWQIYVKPGMLQSLNSIAAAVAKNSTFKTLTGAGNI